MDFTTFREENLKRLSIQNSKELLTKIRNEDKGLLKKINSYIGRNFLNISPKDVIKDILNRNSYAICEFRKNPSKQSFDEKIVCQFINKNTKPEIRVERLKNTKREDKFCIDGKLCGQRNSKQIKSIDAIFYKNEDKLGYITIKKIGENGGSQDNQKNDIIEQVKNFPKDEKDDGKFHFVVLVYGDYFTEERVREIKEYNKIVKIMFPEEFVEWANTL